MEEDRPTVSIEQASKELGVSRMTIYRMIEDGRLPAIRRGYVKSHQYRIPRESIDALKRQSPEQSH